MTRLLNNSALVVSVLTIGVVGSACNSPQTNSKSTPLATGPAWSLQYKASCDSSVDPTDCVGAYGLTINPDGSYEVGPGPKGQVVHGKLDATDFSTLSKATAGIIDGTSVRSSESCNGYFGNVPDYTFTLIKHGHKTEVLHKTGANLCSGTLDPQEAESLHEELLVLANKYYPTPFPDPCLDAASAVEALYPSVTKCRTDADCGYLDTEFNPISNDTISEVFVDNCSVVTPLPVANLAAVNQNLGKLQKALANAQEVCGYRIARPNCTGTKSFASSAAPAVCQQGVCRVNPELGF